jgi:hypothetical protein
MIQDNDIREQIAAVLRRDISVGLLEKAVNAASREMFSQGNAALVDLISSIHLSLGDYYDDRIDESEFRKELSSLMDYIVIDFDEAPARVKKHAATSFQVWLSAPVHSAIAKVLFVPLGTQTSASLVADPI